MKREVRYAKGYYVVFSIPITCILEFEMNSMFYDVDESAYEDFIDRSEQINNNVENDVKVMVCHLASIQQEMLSLPNILRSKEYERIVNICRKNAKKLSRLGTRISWLPTELGLSNSDTIEIEKGVVVEVKDVKFEQHEDYMRIVLPELLPRRMRYDKGKKKMEYMYDYDSWFTSYNMAFQKQFEYGKFKMFNTKVVLMYIHHVCASLMPDVDNLETKDMTDLITSYLLTDDSYKYMCRFEDMVEDSENFTEIFICPVHMMEQFL